MEGKITRYISKLPADKVRLTEIIDYFTHNISGNKKSTIIQNKILPALINMEKHRKIKLSWDVMLSRYKFPRYIYREDEGNPGGQQCKPDMQLWQRQIEDILKKDSISHGKKVKEIRLQDKYEKFITKYEKSAEEISPSEDWISVITVMMETNLSQYDVMRACIEAFKAGAVWERYREELEE
jgi:hypothetical protein